MAALKSEPANADLLVILITRLKQAKYFAQTWATLYLLSSSVMLGFSILLFDKPLLWLFFLTMTFLHIFSLTAARRQLSFLDTVSTDIDTAIRESRLSEEKRRQYFFVFP
jgi:hypothetical protein